jgi:hypothetical protein
VRFRNAKIEQLRACLRQHHVRRFQIAMHDPVTMGMRERGRDVDSDQERLIQRHWWSMLEAGGQTLPFDVLHHQEIGVTLAADVVQGADVRMRELRDQPRFALEA